MPPVIHYLSHGYASGYGVAGYRMVRALAGAGVELGWTPIDFDHRSPLFADDRASHPGLASLRGAPADPDVIVVHAIPEVLPPVLAARGQAAVICHTVWEADELQPHWPALLNQCDGVVVPTEWNAEVFRAGGVTVPVEVVPHVRDDLSLPADTSWLDDLGDRFVVYSVAAWEGRKAPWRTIEAVGRAFPGDDSVVVVLKTGRQHESADPRFQGPPGRRRDTTWAMAMLARELGPVLPPVHLLERWVPDAQIRGLHERGDVWLSLPHAEGWDIGAFDAATRGTPVITTGWGAPLEYLDPTAHHLVPGDLVPVHLPPDDPHPTRRWAMPDMEAAIEALRAVRADLGGARSRAATQVSTLRERYAPAAVAQRLVTAVERILG